MIKFYLSLFLFLLYPAITNAQVGDRPVVAPVNEANQVTPAQEKLNDIVLHGQLKAFRQNKGQWGNEILYACQTSDNYVYLMRDRLVFGQMEITPEESRHDMKKMPHEWNNKCRFKAQVWNLDFVGANTKAQVIAEKPSEGYFNYLRYTQAEKNATDIHDYEKVIYQDLYPGIDLDYYVQNDHLKYDFRLDPHAKITDIRLKYDGVERLTVDGQGRLHIFAGGKEMLEDRPVSYQLIEGVRKPITVSYRILDKNTYGFQVTSNYNPNYPLVIDPMYLDWSTYFGTPTTNNYTFINGVEVDSMGYVYIAGMTYYYTWAGGPNAPFPTTPGAYDTSGSGWYDGYITKFTQNGSSLVYSTLLGGSSYDWIVDLDVDLNDVVYVTGMTYNWYDMYYWGIVPFPADYSHGYPNILHPYTNVIPPVDTDAVYGYDVFAAKISAKGNSLLGSAVLGGPEEEYPNGIAAGRNGEMYITGTTSSFQYPLSSGAFNPGVRGWSDIYVTMLNTTGANIIYSTRLGGNSYGGMSYWGDAPGQILVNTRGHIFIVGTVDAPDFQFTSNAYNSTKQGPTDIFVTRINPAASGINQLMYSTAVGGTGDERGFGGVLVNDDEVIVAGSTTSRSFPGAINAPRGPSNYDGILVRINTAQSGINGLGNARYIGGSDEDFISDVKINKFGLLYATGATLSTDFNVTPDGQDTSHNGGLDAFMIKTNFDLDTLKYGAYFGGVGEEGYQWTNQYYFWNWYGRNRLGLNTADCIDKAVIGLITSSPDFPTTAGSFMPRRPPNTWMQNVAVVTFRDTVGEYARVELGNDTMLCRGIPITFDAGNAGKGYRYRWNGGRNNDTLQLFTTDTAGTYFVDVFNVCSYRHDTVRLIEANPHLNLGNDFLVCGGFGYALSAWNKNASVLWNTGDTIQQIYVTQGGTYSVIASNYCETVYDTITITQKFIPQKPFGKDTTLCQVFALQLDALEPGGRYMWNDSIDMDTLQYYTADTAGRYRVAVSNECGTTRDTIVLYRKNPPEQVFIGNDTFSCTKFNRFLDARNIRNTLPDKGYVSYRWSTALGDSFNTNVVRDFGTYWVDVRNMCGVVTDTIHIVKDTIPEDILGADRYFCERIRDTIDATWPKSTYIWSTGSTDSAIVVIDSGLYHIQMTNRCGTIHDSIRIFLDYEPVINIGNDTTYCNHVIANLNAFNYGPGRRYRWNTGPNDTLATLTATQPGLYWVDVSGRCGTASDSIRLNIAFTPKVNLGKDTTYCNQVDRQMDAYFATATNYIWAPGGETTSSIRATQPGMYGVAVSNQCGVAVDSIYLDIRHDPAIDLGIDTAYCGRVYRLLDAYWPESTYDWLTGNSWDTTSTLLVTKPGIYRVRVNNRCTTVVDSIRIVVNPLPEVKLGNDTVICDPINLRIDAGPGGIDYVWEKFGSIGRYADVDDYGTYVVTVYNQYNCPATDSMSVLPHCPPEIYVPNAFTPNGDALNPVFKPSYRFAETVKFCIYNRWGELVFTTNSINEGWDGSYKGMNCQDGVYYWTLDYLGWGTEHRMQGIVTLLR